MQKNDGTYLKHSLDINRRWVALMDDEGETVKALLAYLV